MAETVDSITMPLSEILTPEEVALVTGRLASIFPALPVSDDGIRIEIKVGNDHG